MHICIRLVLEKVQNVIITFCIGKREVICNVKYKAVESNTKVKRYRNVFKCHDTQYEVMADLHTDGQNAGWVEWK